ncbi:MAG: MmgE/PrpD family protein [Chloroflexota bacterium]
MSEAFLARVAQHIHALSWDNVQAEVQERLRWVLLDTFGCAFVGHRVGYHEQFVQQHLQFGGPAQATLWVRGGRLPEAHAALVNGTVAHHVEMDDGTSRASLHGGVTIIPAALAIAETEARSGRQLAEAIVAGYDAATAIGRILLPGIGLRRLHPPSMAGCFGAVAAAGKLLNLSVPQLAGALALAGELLPLGPFETFTRGGPIKDLYGGWPAFIGVQAARLAAQGVAGPLDILSAPRDGLSIFLPPREATVDNVDPDPRELLNDGFKAYSTCRSVQPTLTALEQLDLSRIDPARIARVDVESYAYAVGLSEDSDPTTAIGARTSIPYGVASMLLDHEVWPEAFGPDALRDPRRAALAARVSVRVAQDMVQPLIRGARVNVTMDDGLSYRAEVPSTRWTPSNQATEGEIRAKLRRLAGESAPAIETAVSNLASAPDVTALAHSLVAPS